MASVLGPSAHARPCLRISALSGAQQQRGQATVQARSAPRAAEAGSLMFFRPRQTRKHVLARAGADGPSASVESTLGSLNKLYGIECVKVDDGDDEEPEEELLECRVSLDEGEAATVQVSAEKGAGTKLLTLTVSLPLGVVFEEAANECVCVEVDPQGNAAAAGIQVGDVLRACSATVKQMSYPAGNILFGGVGRPVARQVIFRLPLPKDWTDNAFGQTMAALQSNRKEGREVVSLVVERRRGSS